MSTYREIVTKAVIGKGKKKDTKEYTFKVDKKLSKALGCWIFNHDFTPIFKDDKTYIKGSYDISVWYAYEQDSKTALFNTKQEYEEEVILKMKPNEKIKATSELKAFCLKYPVCSKLEIGEDSLLLTVDKEFALDVIGEAKLKIQVSKLEEDEWNLEEEIESSIDPNYLEKKEV